MTSSKRSFDHTGGGVVLDIGTGDGRFVTAHAAKHPDKFFIGIDANVKALERPSMKATRKSAKGGLANLMFVQAAVEDLPEEFAGVADEIHIHFPWGSLLRAVATGDADMLRSLRGIAAPGCLLEIVIGIDPERDRAEIERLGITLLTPVTVHSYLIPKYISAGFEYVEARVMRRDEWKQLETSWARRLSVGTDRTVTYILFRVPFK